METRDVANQFNEAINGRDLESLAALMTDDFRFVDPAGTAFEGKERGRDIWRQFFDGFPDYRNHFETLAEVGDTVVITGYSTCSDPRLDGRALWTARIAGDKVREWCVHEDTPAQRALLGIP